MEANKKDQEEKAAFEFKSLREMGEYAHVERQAILMAIKRGHMNAVRVGRSWCCNKSDIDHYLENKFNREEKKMVGGQKVFDTAKGFFSVKAAEKYLSDHLGRKFGRSTLYYYLSAGYLGAYKVGSAWVVPVQELEKYIQIEKEALAAVE